MGPVRKHSVSISGHRTSYSLEDAFHSEIERLAGQRGCTVAELVAQVDADRPREVNLSSALRLHVLADLKGAASDKGGA